MTDGAFAALEERANQLMLQLHAVGGELAETRAVLAQQVAVNESLQRQLTAIETGVAPASSASARRYRDREALILLPRVLELFAPDDALVVVDGGAREVDRDLRWRPFPPSRLRFFGFEPDAAEARRLSGLTAPERSNTEFFPAGLWGTTGKARFERNNVDGGSSFLEQNRVETDRWKFENPTQTALAREIFRPIDYTDIDVVTLDDWAERVAVREIDFLKLNVQGGELEVLRGAERTLGSVLGVLLEVAFVESYQSRPLFHDVDRFLGEAGFTFFDLLAHHYVGRVESPIAAQHLSIVEPKLGQLVSSWGQLVEGHALYLRDPIGRPSAAMPFARVLKLIALAETWGQIEFAFELLAWLNRASDLVDGPTAERVQTIIERGADEYLSYLRPGVPRPNSSR